MRAVEKRLRDAGLSDKKASTFIFDDWNASAHLLVTTDPSEVPRWWLEEEEEHERPEEVPEGQTRESPKGQRRRLRQTVRQAKEGWRPERERETVMEYERMVSSSMVRFDHPSSYPESLLTVPRPLAIRLLLSIVPPSVLEGARFRSLVFVGPDVELPRRFHVHISAGLRYMLFNKPRLSLVLDAYDDFVRRIRWQLHFLDENKDKSDTAYDPDYDLHMPSHKAPPKALQYIEDGLTMGRDFVLKHTTMSAPLLKSRKDFGFVELTDLRQFLDDKQYVITLTDKNLGAAVVTKDWIIAGGYKLLSDELNYRKVDKQYVISNMKKIHRKIDKLCEFAIDGWSMMDDFPQLLRFLRSKMPEDGSDEYLLPEFYAIPKIHKKPTGYRPICPCHSLLQEPCSKVVSKYLKEMLNAFPTVIKGTKDLAQKLSKVKLVSDRKVFICTGDIVAYYPNLPRDPAIKIVGQYWKDWCRDKQVPAWKMHVVLKCMLLSCRSPLFMKFRDEYYEQVRGIPMGSACAPDIANLYGAHFEFQQLTSHPDPRIAFFGRYIDDCLCICYANTETEAYEIVSQFRYDGVQLDWSASEWSAPFLDMYLYIDRRFNTLEYKPYRKPLNHMERIPWASHHPKDVKRGTFLGEMSRLATISSRPDTYAATLRDLRGLYMARGYPQELLNSWIEHNADKRWRNRLADPVRDTGHVFVLKSEFNPIWETFNIHDLHHTIIKSWSEGRDALPWCNLEGRCALHNHNTIPMPDNVRADVNKRLDSLYKHRFSGSAEIASGSRIVKRRLPSEDLTQSRLDSFVSEGQLLTKRPRIGSVSRDESDVAMFASEVARYSSSEEEIEDSADLPARSSPVDLSVSCRSTDTSLPRLVEPDGPFSHLVTWESVNGRASFSHKESLDLTKTDFLKRRMLVSRKRTRNMFDLTSAWRKAMMKIDSETAPDADSDPVNAWN
jgi:hypothetical protein